MARTSVTYRFHPLRDLRQEEVPFIQVGDALWFTIPGEDKKSRMVVTLLVNTPTGRCFELATWPGGRKHLASPGQVAPFITTRRALKQRMGGA